MRAAGDRQIELDDCVFEQGVPPRRDALLAVAQYADVFDDPKFEWEDEAALRFVREHGYVVGMWVYVRAVGEWNSALWNRGLVVLNYSELVSTEVVRDLFRDPTLVASAGLPIVLALLTRFSRGERFSDGYIGYAFETGLMQATMRRLQALASGYSDGRT